MKFTKRHRHPFTDTARKRSFIPIKNRREQEKFPLFAAEIADGQNHDVDAIMADRAIRWANAEAEERSQHARKWIIFRRMIKLLPDHERHAWLQYYYRVRFPRDPGYMRSMLADFLRGRYVMVDGKVVSQNELDFIAQRSAKIAGMSDEQLLRVMQSPYATEHYIEELRAERQRRQQQEMAA